MTNIVAVLIFALFLSGCAALDRHPVASGLAFQGVTLRAIENSSDRQGTARAIVDAAEDFRKALDDESVSLGEVVAKVRARIAASDRPLSEKAALNALLTAAELEVERQIKDGVLDADEKVTIRTVLGWIADAAKAYAG